MANPQRSKVTADLKKNRLVITIGATATKSELARIYTDIRFCVADLKPGFDVITDLSRCTIGHLNGLATFKKIMDFLVTNRVGRVVRVVGGTNIVFRQLLGIATKFRSYKPIYVASLKEAEEVLRQPVEPHALCFQIHRRPVTYTVGSERMTGQLVDISTAGCTVEGASSLPAVGQELVVTISLHHDQHELTRFDLKARVVSLDTDRFAVTWTELETERREVLYQCLINEVRRDMA